MSPSLTVAVGQAAFTIGDVDANLETIDGLAWDAAATGAELVVAPELAVTGYTAEASSLELAEPIEGPITTRLGEIATNHGIALAVSVLEQAEDKVFNTGMILGPTGQLLARHRKTHLFGHERRIFTAGDDAVTIASVGSFAVALLVCYEVEFPEMVRAAALAGADLVVVPTATWTYGQGSPFARQVIGARATENNLFVAYANHCGPAADGDYMGDSIIVGPRAHIEAEAGGRPEVCVATLDIDDRVTGAATVPYLADRRPELYSGLCAPNPVISR